MSKLKNWNQLLNAKVKSKYERCGLPKCACENCSSWDCIFITTSNKESKA